MRCKIFIFSICIITAINSALLCKPAAKYSLKECYKTGALKLKENLKINIDSVPENVDFKGIADFVLTKKGYIFTTDVQLNSINIFSRDGKFLKTIGRKGNGPGDLYLPEKLGYNGIYIIVWEIGNQRFSVFSEEGDFIKNIKPGEDLGVTKIRSFSTGEVIIETEKYNYGKNIGQECILKLYSKEFLFSKDIYKQRVFRKKFITKPVKIGLPQPYPPRVSWDISSENVIIGFQNKYEIGIYDRTGNKLSSFSHKYRPLKVTQKDKKKFFESIHILERGQRLKGGAPKYVIENTTFPEYKPAFLNIVVDSEDNILVLPYQENKIDDPSYFEAFEPNGKFIQRVTVTSGNINFNRLIFKDNYLWSLILDEEDEIVLVKYNISR